MVGAPEEYTQDRASEGEGRIKQVGLQKCLDYILYEVFVLDVFFALFIRSLVPNGRRKNLRKKSRMKSSKLSQVCGQCPKWRNPPFPVPTAAQPHLVAKTGLTVVLVEETGRGRWRWRITEQGKRRKKEDDHKRGERKKRTTETGRKNRARGVLGMTRAKSKTISFISAMTVSLLHHTSAKLQETTSLHPLTAPIAGEKRKVCCPLKV